MSVLLMMKIIIMGSKTSGFDTFIIDRLREAIEAQNAFTNSNISTQSDFDYRISLHSSNFTSIVGIVHLQVLTMEIPFMLL